MKLPVAKVPRGRFAALAVRDPSASPPAFKIVDEYGDAVFSVDEMGNVRHKGMVLPLAASGMPVITTQPVSQTVDPGDPVAFSVEVTGTPPINYQWKKGFWPISGATNSTYTIDPVAEEDEGTYSCYISNSAGNATTSAATLSVNDP